MSGLDKAEFDSRTAKIIEGAHSVLAEAQSWDEGHFVEAKDEFEGYDAGPLRQAMTRESIRPHMVVVLGCPGCE